MQEAILLAYLDNMIGQDSSALSYNPYFSKNVYLHWWSYNSYEGDMPTDEEQNRERSKHMRKYLIFQQKYFD